ncbi:hypothetical protein K3495_g1105 [Podosphaera aphanis]|nr:hypothetical protein K3495_g1105 [Podosphaera aphanis]
MSNISAYDAVRREGYHKAGLAPSGTVVAGRWTPNMGSLDLKLDQGSDYSDDIVSQ